MRAAAEKKRIIYIGGFELPDKNAAAQRVMTNAVILRELGYDVVFIDIDRECKEDILKTKRVCGGFDRWSVKYSNKRLYSSSDFKKVYGKYNDVAGVIAYNYPAAALYGILRFCRRSKIWCAADCTEWYGALAEDMITRAVKGVDSYFRMNIIQPRLDGVIAVSRYIYNYYSKRTNTVLLPPLVDARDEKWHGKNIGERLVFSFVGTLGVEKDRPNYMVEAFSKIKSDYVFNIVGIPEEEYTAHYPEHRELIKQMRGKIIFRGTLPHKKALEFVKNADFTVFCRDKTRMTNAGFPTKFVESITCGTPVITTRTSDLGEYLKDGENGFFVDSIEDDLPRIFERGTAKMKSMSGSVDKETFDYRRYEDKMKDWIISLEKRKTD